MKPRHSNHAASSRLFLLFIVAACASAIPTRRSRISDEDERAIFTEAYHRHRQRAISSPYLVSYEFTENVCTDDRCNNVAELFLKSVKKSMNPCDDFYGYSCGRKQSKMPSITKEIQEILEQQSADKEETKSLALERRLYRSCMEQQDGEHKTKREFTRLLELSDGLSLFRREKSKGDNKKGLDWQSIDNFYASLGFENAFFNVHVTRDPRAEEDDADDSDDVNLISLMPPSPLYFYSVHSLLKYKNLTGIVSNLLQPDDAESYVTDYEDVIGFNNALHEILPPLGMFEENVTSLIGNKMTLAHWQSVYDSVIDDQGLERPAEKNHIDWLRLLNSLLKTANVRIDKHDYIVLKKLDYFTKLAELLDRTSPVTVEKYIHFKFLTQISKYLSPSLARFFENIPDRSTFCIKQSDNQLIGATYEYIKRHVPHEQKVYAEEVIQNIREALSDLLSNAKWMDNETKTYAINKLKHLKIVVGYPDWQRDRKLVNNYYGNLHLHSNFFENIIKYRRRALIHELRGLKHPHLFDPNTMSKKFVPLMYHFEVNSHTNRILFPTEYLNENKYKLFSPKLPSAINYGSFGSMLGSILYDYVSLTDNLKYNEFYTRTIEGLSKDTIDAYKVKEKCLSNQLINYKKSASKFDQPLASVIDRDTIQVDKIYEKMTGLRAAFEAYRKVESETSAELLPGFEDMSQQQLFFLSYAERICEIGDIYDNYDAYETSLKVNGVVANLEAFSDVFLCPKDSPMNRQTKCELFS
ncbi:endothelin-converting enzyme 1 [Nasonia vitripennis]|uniref:Uncharacterized protein n=1 Tax=Nasonia vitripennis TaxID=7425 RepID=A0A7M7Q1K7_NASVI|nr:endothelin-converting enzyme 1 [Nasonia vitripennis]